MQREPVLLWKHFEDLCQIPRGSGNEAGVRAHIRAYAEQRGFGYQEDVDGNCVVSVPGRGQGVSAPAVIIQAHSDMVCVKEQDREHDFTRDPIRTREIAWTENGVTKDVLMATGTTLGADNGLGLVAGLAAADDPALTDCPPLELLVTVQEEVGLIGARQLDPALLCADLLLNLDTEELGEICVSCAGSRDMTTTWQIERSDSAAPGEIPVRLFIGGLPGGHSGIQIHERRGNAILMLLQELLRLDNVIGTVKLGSLSGGTARNVIPSRAEIVLWASEAQADQLAATFREPALRARIQAAIIEAGAGEVVCGADREATTTAPRPLSTDQTQAILNAIAGIPHGVQAWSEAVPGLVETSNNVAVVETTAETITLQCSTRSSRDGAIAAFQESAQKPLEASGAAVVFGEGYPGWPADTHNVLLRQAEKTFTEVLGTAPKVVAVHAGLECGVFKGKRPTLQMISFGPDIVGAHTTKERVVLDSVPPFYACLTRLLQALAIVST
jgi:dipeptidase D